MTNWKCCEKEPPERTCENLVVRRKDDQDMILILDYYDGGYCYSSVDGFLFKLIEPKAWYEWRYACE
jgi:hypothetical protein